MEAQELALLQAVWDDPEDDAPRLVYADWLEERGDPRAELIRVQCELARLADGDPRLPALRQRQARLLDEHRAEWLGAMARVHNPPVFERGFAVLDGDPWWKPSPADYDPEGLRPGRILNEATLRHSEASDARDASRRYLAASPHIFLFPRLRLEFSFFPGEIVRSLAASPVLSPVRELVLNMHIDALREFFHSPYLCRLSRLDLVGYYQGTDSQGFKLYDSTINHAGVEELIAAPIATRLTYLNIRENGLSDESAEALIASRNLGRLEVLDITRNNELSDRARRALSERFRTVL